MTKCHKANFTRGNKYEGHTLIDILKKFQDKFKLENKPIVVADRGMLNNANIAYLEENNYKYILAAKTKSISNDLKQEISNLTFIDDGTIHTLKFNKDISYKEKIDDITIVKSINVNQSKEPKKINIIELKRCND